MDKATIVKAAQAELLKHHWDNFVDEPPSIAQGGKGVVVVGCVGCRKRLNTTNQFMRHLAEDVMPQIIEQVLIDAMP